MRDDELLLGPRDADVGETTLLFQFDGIVQRTTVREHPLLDPDDEHDGKLEAFRRVQRHQRDVVVLGQVVGIGDECDLFEELVHQRELARHADQLLQVLLAASGLDRAFGCELGEVSARFHRMAQHDARTLVEQTGAGIDE